MQLLIISCIIATAVADRLDNVYLPPSNSRTAAGNGNFLNAPIDNTQNAPSNFGNFKGSPSANYGTPEFSSNGHQEPSVEYGAPSAEYGAPIVRGSSENYAQRTGNGGVSKSREGGAAILRYDNENFGDGSYKFEFETENGISQQESGEVKNSGSGYESSAVKGSYSYTGNDGQTYTVNYIADENGFQPFGEHIAQISQAVQTSLQKNAAEAQQGYQYSEQSSSSGLESNFQPHGSNDYNQASNRQYLAPNKPGFNQQSGYQY